MIAWTINGRELANCNCDYGCPCQFNALPTTGNCKAAIGYQIDEGHFGDVKLDGLHAATVYYWPGPVHEGNGKTQLIVDESADDAQRNALIKIMQGEETEPMATMWAVYAAMCPTKLDPLSRTIDLEIDVENRVGRIVCPRRLRDHWRTDPKPRNRQHTGRSRSSIWRPKKSSLRSTP